MAVDLVAKIALAPLLLAQAALVRRRALGLPEPEGPRHGITGNGAPLRLLIAGDSSAAGVGASTQDEALSGRLLAGLAPQHRLEWQLVARTGATSANLLAMLAALPAQSFDVAVIAIGVNDVTRGVPLRKWLAQQTALLDLLRHQLGLRHIHVCGLPPMQHYPLLPFPLNWVLGRQAARYDSARATLVARAPQTHYFPFDFPFDPAKMAPDGYHPAPAAYAIWADALATQIRAGLKG